MTLGISIILFTLLLFLGRAYWVISVIEEEYEFFKLSLDHYHSRHNAVARAAVMAGHEFQEWPQLPHFRDYSIGFLQPWLNLKIWSRSEIVSRKYLDQFEEDLNRLKKKYS